MGGGDERFSVGIEKEEGTFDSFKAQLFFCFSNYCKIYYKDFFFNVTQRRKEKFFD